MAYQRTTDRNASQRAGHRTLLERVHFPAAEITPGRIDELGKDGWMCVAVERGPDGLAVEYAFTRKARMPGSAAPTEAR
jgi:hypothetical protein